MVLFTHAVVGGAIGVALRSHPVSAFLFGFLSHFVLDAMPHWDYHLESSRKHSSGDRLQGNFVMNRSFVFDLIKIGTDLLTGAVIVYLFLYGDVLNISAFLVQGTFWGMVGGVLPDVLQFVYYKTKREPLTTLQKFHLSVHTQKRLDGRYVIGPLLQIGVVVLAVLISRFTAL